MDRISIAEALVEDAKRSLLKAEEALAIVKREELLSKNPPIWKNILRSHQVWREHEVIAAFAANF